MGQSTVTLLKIRLPATKKERVVYHKIVINKNNPWVILIKKMGKMFKKEFLLIIVLSLPFFVFSQENKSIDSLKQIIKKIPSYNNIEKAKQLILLGQQYVFSSDFPAAVDCYQKSLEISQNINNDSLQGSCYSGLAVIAYYQQDFYKDSIYNFKALKIFRKNHYTLREGKLLKNIAASYAQRGNLSEANKYFEEALSIFIKSNQPKFVAGIYSNMAAIYRWDFRKSIVMGLAAKKIWDQYPNDGVLPAANTGNLGIYYFYMVKFDSLKSIKHDSIIPTGASENLKKAEAYLRQAIQMAHQNNDINNQSHFTGELADLQAYKGDYKDAYNNISMYYNTQDSIFSQQNKNKIAALESKRTIDAKNTQIENEKLQISNQRKNVWLLAGLIAFLVILGSLLYYQNRNRKKTNTALWHLNKELDEANRVKAKFFGILSHDLRSPVANLINFLQLQKIKRGWLSEEQISDHESEITDSAKSLLQNMEAILLWSKGQMEHFKPDISEVPAKKLFSFLQKFFADTKHIAFTFLCQDNLIVRTDELYMETILQNLTANAIKALQQTPNAKIEWKAWEEINKRYFSISDNGPGIDNAQLKSLYDETAISGSKHGLGLHIIRDMAKAIGCEITLNSQKVTGTEFILCLSEPGGHNENEKS